MGSRASKGSSKGNIAWRLRIGRWGPSCNIASTNNRSSGLVYTGNEPVLLIVRIPGPLTLSTLFAIKIPDTRQAFWLDCVVRKSLSAQVRESPLVTSTAGQAPTYVVTSRLKQEMSISSPSRIHTQPNHHNKLLATTANANYGWWCDAARGISSMELNPIDKEKQETKEILCKLLIFLLAVIAHCFLIIKNKLKRLVYWLLAVTLNNVKPTM